MITLLGLTLGLLEIIFISTFLVLLVIGASFDRKGQESFKWWTFVIGFACLIGWFWKDLTITMIWDTLRSWSFWEPILMYLGAGLVYSILEFVLDVRRSAREYKASWEQALQQDVRVRSEPRSHDVLSKTIEITITLKELFDRVAQRIEFSNDLQRSANDAIENYVRRNRNRDQIVQLEYDTQIIDGHAVNSLPQAKINKTALSEHIGAWSVFWPFYLVSLVLGDLLTEFWNMVSTFFITFGGRFIRRTFRDVFKV